MLQLQSGLITEALRRFGNLRGSISPELDESVAPIMDPYELPWRQDGVQWIVGATIGATPGNLSTVSIQDDRPAGDRSILAIEGICFQVATTSNLVLGWGGSVIGGGSAAVSGELPVRDPSVTGALSPLPFRCVPNAGIAGTRVTLSMVPTFPPQTAVPLFLPIFAIVPPQLAFYVETGTANTQLTATFFGRYWRQVG